MKNIIITILVIFAFAGASFGVYKLFIENKGGEEVVKKR